MAQAYSTGAALLYAGIGINKIPIYVGTFETKPLITIDPAWSKLKHVLAGTANAFDEGYQGSIATVSGVLTRFNAAPLEAMMSRPDAGEWGRAGSWALSDIGKLFQIEGMSWPCWVQFPRAFMYGGAMVSGYRFFSCKLVGPDRIDPSTEGMKIGVIIEAKPIMIGVRFRTGTTTVTRPTTQTQTPPGGWDADVVRAAGIIGGAFGLVGAIGVVAHDNAVRKFAVPAAAPVPPQPAKTTTSSVNVEGRWWLYDHNMIGLPPFN